MDTEAQISFPGWQYSIATGWCWGSHPHREGQQKLPIWNPPDSSPGVLPWPDFTLKPFSLIKSNCEQSSFQCYWNGGWFGEPTKLTVSVRTGTVFRRTVLSAFTAWLTLGERLTDSCSAMARAGGITPLGCVIRPSEKCVFSLWGSHLASQFSISVSVILK